jgi:hypothetical protein
MQTNFKIWTKFQMITKFKIWTNLKFEQNFKFEHILYLNKNQIWTIFKSEHISYLDKKTKFYKKLKTKRTNFKFQQNLNKKFEIW